MHEATRDGALRAAKDQALFREVNERIRDMNEAFETKTRDSRFICECANRDCMDYVTMTVDEYEEVRRVTTHFVVTPAPDHVFRGVERVAREAEHYFVVEKFGEAGIAAVKLDPRSRRVPSHH